MINTKMGVFLLVGFVAGAFVASPELRAYAAATIGSADIIDNSIQSIDIKDSEIKVADIGNGQVTAPKIKDGEVKAAEIATDAVGAAELQGVSKLIFGSCSFTNSISLAAGSLAGNACFVNGIATGDKVIVTRQGGNACIVDVQSIAQTGSVLINYSNVCNTAAVPGTMTFSVIAYLQ